MSPDTVPPVTVSQDEAPTRRARFHALELNCKAIAIWLFLSDHLPLEQQMNITQLKAMKASELTAIYNKLTDKQVKRMGDRADVEFRTRKALQAAGQWETKAEGKAARKAKAVAKAAAPVVKKPAKKIVVRGTKRGAPRLNRTYTAIGPQNPAFNPEGFTVQPASTRGLVLAAIRGNKGRMTREEIVAHFAKKKLNLDSALYFLTTNGFVRMSGD